jgi:hypothetical protein
MTTITLPPVTSTPPPTGATPIPTVPMRQPLTDDEIQGALAAYTAAGFCALHAQISLFADQAWLRKQPPAGLAVLHGVLRDKLTVTTHGTVGGRRGGRAHGAAAVALAPPAAAADEA